jgi:anti-anti-sigma factor
MDTSPVPPPDGTSRLTVTTVLGQPSVLTVEGESDLDNIAPFSRAVDAAVTYHPRVVLDLAGVTFADSTFLTALVTARNKALEKGGSIRLLAVSPAVRRLLDLTGADVLFPLATPGPRFGAR